MDIISELFSAQEMDEYCTVAANKVRDINPNFEMKYEKIKQSIADDLLIEQLDTLIQDQLVYMDAEALELFKLGMKASLKIFFKILLL